MTFSVTMWSNRVLVLLVLQLLNYAEPHCDEDNECPDGEYLEECAGEICEGEYCPYTECDPKPEDCPAADPDNCYTRCLCNPGLLRNDTGQCVAASLCPPIQCTGPYEEAVACPRACPGETCADSVTNPAHCLTRPRIPVRCRAACRCISGYFRNECGDCVPYDECSPQTCPDGESLSTCPPTNCAGQFCPVSSTAPHSCPTRAPCGTPQCTCNFNTRRSRRTGACIPIKDCPPFKCPGKNEEYQSCPLLCLGETCNDYLTNATCPKFRIGIVVECKPQCRCRKGYYRDDHAVCVPAAQCKPPGCNGDPNAQEGCGVPCGRTCKLYNKGPVPCSRICKQNACDCKPDYVLNEDTGKCVLPEQCPEPQCPKGETWNECAPKPCPADYCPTSDDTPASCPASTASNNTTGCRGRCVCGFQERRSSNGTCISATQCPPYKCSRPHESFLGCQRCEKCSYIRADGRCSAVAVGVSKIVVPCVPGCYCDEGYYRNDDGVCVLKDRCPQFGCNNDPNAEPGCGVPCGRTCALLNKTMVACPKICKVNGCDCKEGFVLNDDTGKCVRPQQCPLKCTGKNEFFQCGGACDNICETLAKQNQTHCNIINIQCNRMCYCKEGFARNRNNVCVPFDQCEPVKCPGDHEYFACGVACDNVCKTLSRQNQTSCPIINKKCNEMCYCEDGFARNKHNKCVPYDQCEGEIKTSLSRK